MTEMGWEISPPGLVAALRLAHQALPELDLWVTENGAATREDDDGTAVHDPERITYLRDHLDAVLTARQAGLPVRGYYVWSLMDNLEWAFGWTKRFGLVRVEEGRQQRREKDSAMWLRQTLARRRS
jgi:beta-glucosidase